MPRIGKNISTNSSSEIINSTESDSESSSSSEPTYGSGEEGSSASSTVVAHKRTPSERHVLPSSIRGYISVICPIIAVAGAISLISSGIELNKPTSDNEHRKIFIPFFVASTLITSVGSILSVLACVKHPDSSPQVPNA